MICCRTFLIILFTKTGYVFRTFFMKNHKLISFFSQLREMRLFSQSSVRKFGPTGWMFIWNLYRILYAWVGATNTTITTKTRFAGARLLTEGAHCRCGRYSSSSLSSSSPATECARLDHHGASPRDGERERKEQRGGGWCGYRHACYFSVKFIIYLERIIEPH